MLIMTKLIDLDQGEIEKLYKAPSKWILATPYYSVRNQHLYGKAGFKKVGESEDKFLFLYEKYVE